MHVTLNNQTPTIEKKSIINQQVKTDSGTELSDNSQNSWLAVSERCNVTNCSYDCLMQAITELYIDGEITHKDFETFEIDKDNNDSFFASRGFNVMTNPYRTPADQDGNRNWIKEFEIKLAEAKHRHDEKAAATYKSVVEILTRLSEVIHA